MAILTMDTVLNSVLATGNKEQNQMYPPHVYDAHFNLVTSFLIDEISKLFPTSQTIIDMIRPFLATVQIPVVGGEVVFPADYRRLIGAAIFVTSDFMNNCDPSKAANADQEKDCCGEPVFTLDSPNSSCDLPGDPLAPSIDQVRQNQKRGQCLSSSVRVVDIDEWDHLTDHSYKFPTLKKPIGCIFEGKSMRICPFDVPAVEIRYIRQPKRYKYGYLLNPDDTYSWNPATTIESEWTENAYKNMVNGITTLFSIYVRDGELRDGITQLKQLGMF